MKSKRVAAAIAASMWVMAAGAQVPTSTHDIVPSSSPPELTELQQSDAALRDLVTCVIRYQPARTRNLLDTIPGTYGEETIIYSFQSRINTCFDYYRVGGRALLFPNVVLRGAIAEAYYRRDFPQGISPSAVPPEASAAWARPRVSDGEVTQREMIHSMARCVILRKPAGVIALLRTAPLSAEERSAMRGLQSDLSACLDSNVSFNASRQTVRALLAEAALHYAESQRHGFTRVGRPTTLRGSE
jgi:hypothetical protein